MGVFDFWKTATEKKRDDYDELHDSLKDAIKEHDEKMEELESELATYKKGMPELASTGIPANPFVEKRDDVIERLEKYINKEKNKRKTLTEARDTAYQKYLEYKAMAVKEEKAEKAKKEKKEREERRKNG